MNKTRYGKPIKKISVIIPAHNASLTIKRCILSVIQTGYPSLEIIVVNDASVDDSSHIIETLSREYPETIIFVQNKENSGPAKTRNIGASCATSEFLFFLDSDTEVQRDIFDNFVYRMTDADAVTGIYSFQSLNPGFVPSYKAMFNYYFFSRSGVIAYEVFDASRAGIKAEVFRRLGGFNENIRWGMDYENEEFGYRLCKDYKNLLDPSVIVRHRFPGFKKLTKTYFNRAALWTELFFFRKKFESAGLTSRSTGIATASMLLALISLLFGLINKYFNVIALFFFFIYIYGYAGFFWFVARRKVFFLPAAIMLNIYFTFIISAAAVWGFFKGSYRSLYRERKNRRPF